VVVGCGSSRAAEVGALTGDAVAGAAVFAANCASCHGADGGGGSGPTLAGAGIDVDSIIAIVLSGEGNMPAFDGTLADQDIADVSAYATSM